MRTSKAARDWPTLLDSCIDLLQGAESGCRQCPLGASQKRTRPELRAGPHTHTLSFTVHCFPRSGVCVVCTKAIYLFMACQWLYREINKAFKSKGDGAEEKSLAPQNTGCYLFFNPSQQTGKQGVPYAGSNYHGSNWKPKGGNVKDSPKFGNVWQGLCSGKHGPASIENNLRNIIWEMDVPLNGAVGQVVRKYYSLNLLLIKDVRLDLGTRRHICYTPVAPGVQSLHKSVRSHHWAGGPLGQGMVCRAAAPPVTRWDDFKADGKLTFSKEWKSRASVGSKTSEEPKALWWLISFQSFTCFMDVGHGLDSWCREKERTPPSLPVSWYRLKSPSPFHQIWVCSRFPFIPSQKISGTCRKVSSVYVCSDLSPCLQPKRIFFKMANPFTKMLGPYKPI